jgi:hypothetical protein
MKISFQFFGAGEWQNASMNLANQIKSEYSYGAGVTAAFVEG